jgi:hypothetical protein
LFQLLKYPHQETKTRKQQNNLIIFNIRLQKANLNRKNIKRVYISWELELSITIKKHCFFGNRTRVNRYSNTTHIILIIKLQATTKKYNLKTSKSLLKRGTLFHLKITFIMSAKDQIRDGNGIKIVSHFDIDLYWPFWSVFCCV